MPLTGLVVLTGLAGSGKSSLAEELRRRGAASRLLPYVVRERGGRDDSEFHVLERRPPRARVLWSIDAPGGEEGMLRQELERLPPGAIGLAVVGLDRVDAVEALRAELHDLEVVVVGLDTVADQAQQRERVGGDAGRVLTPERFSQERERLSRVDLLLRGGEGAVADAGEAVCRIMRSKGGMLTRELLAPLLGAGSVLTGTDPASLKSASYDLRVGDEVWCAGFRDLTVSDPIFEIPPYSYAIVKAAERAALPTFMTGQFDLRVSLFLSGVILSNGPQVDPGYRGDLFCMLFNGNSEPRRLRMGDRFCTIQFMTTARTGEPYAGEYSIREKLRRSMPADAAAGPGGSILSKVASDIDRAKREVRSEFPKDRAGLFLGLISILAGLSVAVALWTASVGLDANKAAAEAAKAAAEAKAVVEAARRPADTSAPIAEPTSAAQQRRMPRLGSDQPRK